MAKKVQIKLTENWKGGAPFIESKIIYAGRTFEVDVENPSVKKEVDHYEKAGAIALVGGGSTKKSKKKKKKAAKSTAKEPVSAPEPEVQEEEPSQEELIPESDPSVELEPESVPESEDPLPPEEPIEAQVEESGEPTA